MTTTSNIAPTHAPNLPSLSAATFDEFVRSAELPVIVDLWAEWCGPCHALSRSLEEIAAERIGTLVIVSLDTDAHPDVARRYEALSVPTMLFFRDGELVGRLVGARPTRRLAADIDAIFG